MHTTCHSSRSVRLYNSYGIFKLLAKEGIVGCVPFKTLRKVQMVCELDKLIPAQTDVILSRFLIDISGIKIRSLKIF
jgi:hypothetical protein